VSQSLAVLAPGLARWRLLAAPGAAKSRSGGRAKESLVGANTLESPARPAHVSRRRLCGDRGSGPPVVWARRCAPKPAPVGLDYQGPACRSGLQAQRRQRPEYQLVAVSGPGSSAANTSSRCWSPAPCWAAGEGPTKKRGRTGSGPTGRWPASKQLGSGPWPDQRTTYRSGFVALIGRSNVGKVDPASTVCRPEDRHHLGTSRRPPATGFSASSAGPDGQILFLDHAGACMRRGSAGSNRTDGRAGARGVPRVDLILWLVEADRPVDSDPADRRGAAQSGAPVRAGGQQGRCWRSPRKLMPLLAAYGRLREFGPPSCRCRPLTGRGASALAEVIPGGAARGPRYYPDDPGDRSSPSASSPPELIREPPAGPHPRRSARTELRVLIESFQEGADRKPGGDPGGESSTEGMAPSASVVAMGRGR